MSATFHGLQETENPMDGTVLADAAFMLRMFESLSRRAPFVFELPRRDGDTLTIGLAGAFGFTQFGSGDGWPPYYIALNDREDSPSEPIRFLAGNQLTEVPGRF